ncbi:MAG TPA: hypothetical protein DDY91_11620 [Planctomycetaceae bacterium]|jgi:hypothetical protein|nr:hypothetical protein [Planctomycetaceae bacterium]
MNRPEEPIEEGPGAGMNVHSRIRIAPLCRGLLWWGLCFLGGWSLVVAGAAERVTLEDDPGAAQVFEVATALKVEGKIYPQPGAKSALPLKVDAGFRYRERRGEGAGRQAQSLRSVRYYDQAGASITAGNQVSNVSLRDEARLIVVEGTDSGVELSSPSIPLRVDELELLRAAGDSLVVAGLLPREAVEAGDTWKPASWVLPTWAGIEAVEKSQLSCTLERIDSQQAVIRFQGEVIGAVWGAAARVTVEGALELDLAKKHWKKLTLNQTEKRAVGAVSPGLDVTAKVETTRRPARTEGRLSEMDLKGVPLAANEATRLVVFEAPLWNLRFYHDRNWHLLNQNSDTSTLRYVEQGDLLAQCTIKKLPEAQPGKHVSEELFRADIEKALGKNFEKFVQAERLKLGTETFVYRVVVQGTVKTQNDKDEEILQPMQWHYYLVADAQGRQLALVFTFTPEHAKRFADRDLAIVGGLEFFQPNAPTEARGGNSGGRK